MLLRLLFLLALAAPAEPLPHRRHCSGAEADGSWRCRARDTASTLLHKYQQGEDGLFGQTLPWVEANAIESLADWTLLEGGLNDPFVAPVRAEIETMLERGFNSTDKGVCHTPFCGSYDDQAWWALAWLKCYELTADSKYLFRAVQIFEYLRQNSWDETRCGGGCWWSRKKEYKNSITNELFFSLAAQLHEGWERFLGTDPGPGAAPFAFPRNFFLGWAQAAWSWIESSDLRGANGLFVDGLDSHCRGNGDTLNNTWTYNQGVVLTGLGKLFEFTGDEKLLDTADSIVAAVRTHLTAPAVAVPASEAGHPVRGPVLIEPGCGESCGENQEMFRGAFMRHLGYLRRTPGLPSARAGAYRRFAESSAQSAWWHARQEQATFAASGPPTKTQLIANDWRGPFAEDEVATSQVAALALFASLLQPPHASLGSIWALTDGAFGDDAASWAWPVLGCAALGCAGLAGMMCVAKARGQGTPPCAGLASLVKDGCFFAWSRSRAAFGRRSLARPRRGERVPIFQSGRYGTRSAYGSIS